MPKRFVVTSFFVFVAAVYFFGNTGCANIIPPQGGPRDSIPPVLVSAVPADSSTNFRSNRIVLTFDEYITLQDVPNNLLFTPTFETNPAVIERGKTVTVKFRDSLMSNTTYTLNFGNAIKDVNESNILKNFVYTFSTGPSLDSLELSGKVVLSETGKVDSTLQVLLHRNLTDSAVIKERPVYVSRLDRNGEFHFKNLPAGTFAIYALGDAGSMRRYMNKNQYFAFSDTAVVTGQTKSITLFAYKETPAVTTVNRGSLPGVRIPGGTDRRLQFSTNLTGQQQDLLKNLIITFQSPIKTFDSTLLTLSTDSSYSKQPYTSSFDSTRKELTLKTTWKEGTAYQLVMDKDFATDTAGRKLLKSDTLEFRTKKSSDYGKLVLRVKNVPAGSSPVLLFIQNDQVVASAPLNNGIYTNNMAVPGEYRLRILFDKNGNGKWDPGQFFGTKRQPERVVLIERTFNVKPDWENDFEISL